jgi:hypothetical protein
MKKNFINYWMMATALVLAVAFTACDKNNKEVDPEEQEETLPIATDKISVEFKSNAIDQHVLSVENTTDWDVLNDAPWVYTEKRADNTLLIKAEPSRSPFNRSATVTIVAGNQEQGTTSVVVTQSHGTPKRYVRQLHGAVAVRHVSENGRWAAGQNGTVSIIVDVTKLTDETYVGTIVDAPDGTHSIDNNGKVHADGCTADGSIYTGYDVSSPSEVAGTGEWFPAQYIPYIVRNNNKIPLAYPTTYATSEVTDERYAPPVHVYKGCTPDRMSADGKYIYGRLHITGTMWAAAKWTRVGTSSNYTFKEIGQTADGDLNQWEKVVTPFEDGSGRATITVDPVSFLCPQNVSGLSPYGKYACGHYGNSGQNGGQLFRYNMEAEELELLDADGIATYITDEGDLFASNGHVYRIGREPVTIQQWVRETYGDDAASAVDPEGRTPFPAVGGISADKSTCVLFEGSTRGTSYIITVEP